MLVNKRRVQLPGGVVIVTHEGWGQRDAFMGALTQCLSSIATRRAYYPGAADRLRAFVDAHPEAESFGHGPDDALAVDGHTRRAVRAYR